MGKRILMLVAALLVLLGVAGGAFYAGTLYQQSRAADIQERFFADRGGNPPAGFAGGGPGGNIAGGPELVAERGAVGDIKSIDGQVLTLSTPQSEVTVTLTGDTRIMKLVAGSLTDLQVGQRITVRGEADSAGNVTASAIQITDQAPAQP